MGRFYTIHRKNRILQKRTVIGCFARRIKSLHGLVHGRARATHIISIAPDLLLRTLFGMEGGKAMIGFLEDTKACYCYNPSIQDSNTDTGLTCNNDPTVLPSYIASDTTTPPYHTVPLLFVDTRDRSLSRDSRSTVFHHSVSHHHSLSQWAPTLSNYNVSAHCQREICSYK